MLTELEDEGFVTMLGGGKGYHLEGKAWQYPGYCLEGVTGKTAVKNAAA